MSSNSLFSNSTQPALKDSTSQETCRFSEFWDAWHGKRRKAKTFAKKAFNKLSEEDQTLAIEQAKIHTKMFEDLAANYGDEILESMKYPQGWLNQHRFKQDHCGVPEFVRNGAGLGRNQNPPERAVQQRNMQAYGAYYKAS